MWRDLMAALRNGWMSCLCEAQSDVAIEEFSGKQDAGLLRGARNDGEKGLFGAPRYLYRSW